MISGARRWILGPDSRFLAIEVPMKLTFWAIVTIVVFLNFGLMLRGEGMLIQSSLTPDQWGRICSYYYPIQIFKVEVPLDGGCPSSMQPTHIQLNP